MSFFLALEVMGGPMDGLICRLTGKKVCIGRKVGNTMTLPLDMRVSRQHAEAIHEGHVWRMREKNSKGGVWIDGRRLGMTGSIPLEPGQIFLIGNAIIEVCQISAEYPRATIDDDCFIDSRCKYAMTPEFEAIWDQVYIDVKEKGYCEIEDVMAAAFNQNDHLFHKKYESIVKMLSSDRWESLEKWLGSVLMPPIFSIELGKTMLTPRIWRILDGLGKKKSPIAAVDFFQGILDEGRSLSARFMANDETFLNDFGLSADRNKNQRFFSNPSGHQDMPGQSGNMDASRSAKQNIDKSMNGLDLNDVGFWQEYALRMEQIILGFVKDAMHRSAEMKGFHLPGFDMRLDDMLQRTGGVGNDQIKEYIGELEKALVGVLSAYRNGMKEYEKMLGLRILNNLKRDRERMFEKNSFMNRDRKKEWRHLEESLFATLKGADLEGSGLQIIRKRVAALFTGKGDMP